MDSTIGIVLACTEQELEECLLVDSTIGLVLACTEQELEECLLVN